MILNLVVAGVVVTTPSTVSLGLTGVGVVAGSGDPRPASPGRAIGSAGGVVADGGTAGPVGIAGEVAGVKGTTLLAGGAVTTTGLRTWGSVVVDLGGAGGRAGLEACDGKAPPLEMMGGAPTEVPGGSDGAAPGAGGVKPVRGGGVGAFVSVAGTGGRRAPAGTTPEWEGISSFGDSAFFPVSGSGTIGVPGSPTAGTGLGGMGGPGVQSE